jgi:hypothetical protein
VSHVKAAQLTNGCLAVLESQLECVYLVLSVGLDNIFKGVQVDLMSPAVDATAAVVVFIVLVCIAECVLSVRLERIVMGRFRHVQSVLLELILLPLLLTVHLVLLESIQLCQHLPAPLVLLVHIQTF